MSAINEIIKTLAGADNEATRAPYWLILDPRQMLDCDPDALASMITGPFFSRPDAEAFLQATRYNFSKRAVVYCHSGNYSSKYDLLCREAEAGGHELH